MDCETNKCNLLEQMLLDANKEPSPLPLSLLESITNKFSEDHKIGSGGFADVYKGLLQNGSVAVKRLSQAVDMDEKSFSQEVCSLSRVKHKNIVRFLGYCADTQGKVEKYAEKMVIADIRQRLLCFEFLPNGSLDSYINGDASQGLAWKTHYGIIKGICLGLHYLHEKNIVHLDLKPPNILLDSNMVPKIADFGLAKCFSGNQTRAVTFSVSGTLGYIAPERYSGVITFKSDIYSLGIIIIEILTGQKGYLPIENVLERWSTRFETLQGGKWLEHVRVCAQIGLQCMDSDPRKRPTMACIVETLDELEDTYGFIEMHDKVEPAYGSIEPDLSATQVLDVYPLDIWFPLEPYELIMKCPVTLTNRTDDFIGVYITPTRLDDADSNPDFPFVWEQHTTSGVLKSSIFKRLGPYSSETIYTTMRKQEKPLSQADKGTFDVVMIAPKLKSDGSLNDVELEVTRWWNKSEDPIMRTAMKSGTVVHRSTLRVAVTSDNPAWCQEVAAHQFVPDEELEYIGCMDVHPTKPWLLVGYKAGGCAYASIWNYETQERVKKLQVNYLEGRKYLEHISSIKFIAAEQWFAAADRNGGVHVYAYTTFRAVEMHKVKEFEAQKYPPIHLAVYPKHTLLLTASSSCSGSVKLWNWSQGWSCAREIPMHDTLHYFKAGPRATSIFAWVGNNHVVKVWDIQSPDAIATFTDGGKLTFYTDGHRDFLASRQNDRDTPLKIWDLQTKEHVHTLRSEFSPSRIFNIASHPTLPILAGIMPRAGFNAHHIILWDIRTYRVMKKFELLLKGDSPKMFFDGNMDVTSLVVFTRKEISIVKINVPTLLASCSK